MLDFLVQSRRDAKASKKLMKTLLKKQGFAPTGIVTDKQRSYTLAFRTLERPRSALCKMSEFG